jgi:hypothetical protein
VPRWVLCVVVTAGCPYITAEQEASRLDDGADSSVGLGSPDDEDDDSCEEGWYEDADGDGLGDPEAPIDDCPPPADAVDNASDCNDLNVYVGDSRPWWRDADGDGWGNSLVSVLACAPPQGHVGRAGDCDDGDDSIYPDAVEICDTIDQDCDDSTWGCSGGGDDDDDD